MIRSFVLFPILFTLGLCRFLPVPAQESRTDNSLLNQVNRISSTTEKYAPEKLYVQTDRPSYNTGDTIWFKTYLFNAAFLRPSSQSGIAYLEISGDDNQVIKRIMVALQNGLGRGYFALDETTFPVGAYTLRAYTNWMRNFDQKCIFQRRIIIHNYSKEEWLIHAGFHTVKKDPNHVKAALVFKQQNKRPLSFRSVEITLTDGNKIWHKNKFKTDVYGNLVLDFKIPSSADRSTLSLLVHQSPASSSASPMKIPIVLNRKSKVDLQFMPEGGECTAGVKNRIAFKAIGEDGLERDISGLIYNSSHKIVDSFRSSHLGMGSFDFTPQKNQKYIAVVPLEDGGTISFPLPIVQDSLPALHLINPLHGDSIAVTLRSGSDNSTADSIFYLIAQSRGIGCLGAKLTLRDGRHTLCISKSLFPSGITRFTVYNMDMRPLNQRMVFIVNPEDHLLPDITGKQHYRTRDKVDLSIKVSDKEGRPLRGSFSVAVTDDNKVYIDRLKRNSLASDIWLTSDLKGYVENPGYYFPEQMTEEIWHNLDNLLLTQGWVSFNRDTTSPSQYRAEPFFSINGKVTNILNKPVAGSELLLFSKKPFFIKDTTTDSSGVFSFGPLYPMDTASYMLQARNKRGKSFNVGITVDAFNPPAFRPLNLRTLPWYVNLDTAHEDLIKTQIDDKEVIGKLLGEHVLKEVVIVGQKAISGSKNLNGPGGSDFALNQSDMEKEGKATLGDVLRQKVKGFRLGGKHLDLYLINTELVHLVIDGVNLDFFKPDDVSYKDFYRSYLDYITAEDIKGIEVMQSARFTGAYFQKFMNPMADPFEHVFIEITTYSGNGAFLKKTPSVFLYKPPLAFNTPARFYSPKYTVKEDKKLPDVRSTIFWQPDLVTNAKGEAQISFYAADKPGTYTLIIEGTDMNGKIGSVTKKIRIE